MEILEFCKHANENDTGGTDEDGEHISCANDPQRSLDEAKKITWLHRAKRLVNQNKALELFCPELSVFCPELCPDPDSIYLLEGGRILALQDSDGLECISLSLTPKRPEDLSPIICSTPTALDDPKDGQAGHAAGGLASHFASPQLRSLLSAQIQCEKTVPDFYLQMLCSTSSQVSTQLENFGQEEGHVCD